MSACTARRGSPQCQVCGGAGRGQLPKSHPSWSCRREGDGTDTSARRKEHASYAMRARFSMSPIMLLAMSASFCACLPRSLTALRSGEHKSWEAEQ